MKKRLRKKLLKKRYPLIAVDLGKMDDQTAYTFCRPGMIGVLGQEPNVIRVLPCAVKVMDARKVLLNNLGAVA